MTDHDPRDESDLAWLAFRYVAREMSAVEQDRFERRLADDAGACEAVAEIVGLREALESIDPPPSWLSLPGRSARRFPVRPARLRLAAAVLLAMFAGAGAWIARYPGGASALLRVARDESRFGTEDPPASERIVRAWASLPDRADPLDAPDWAAVLGQDELGSSGAGSIDGNAEQDADPDVPSWVIELAALGDEPAIGEPGSTREN